MTLIDPHEFPRGLKLAMYLVLDAVLVPLGLYLAHALRYGTATPWDMMAGDGLFFVILTLCGAGVSLALRMNTIMLRVIALRSVLRLATGAALLAVLAMTLSYLMALSGPRSVPIIFGVVYFFGLLTGRLALLGLVEAVDARRNPATRVAIYGAGSCGLQMAAALNVATGVTPRFFIDDNPALQGLILAGLPVYSFARLDDMAQRHGVKRVLLAIPTAERARQADLTHRLTERGFQVQVLPSYTDLMTSLTADAACAPVEAADVFGRDTVALDLPEIAKAYAGRVVLVTGAGGRIGSELCRQLLQCAPSRLVVLDQNETALITLTDDLRAQASQARVALSARLGNVSHRAGIAAILREEGVDVVFHAAAYRNVLLVAGNQLESTRNNVIGAQVMAEAAEAAGVERFVLVSSNKTPQSDSILSATRTMAELVIQDLAGRAKKTRFCVVRMANVLGQKGALLPLMQRQIQSGGPVTIPHPDATRSFVTMTESVRLVLIAGAIARGGDVVMLSPGTQRNLLDLAQRLIRRTGRSVKDAVTGEGDIEIRFTGLRPGELLSDDVPLTDTRLRATKHPAIQQVMATKLSQIEVASMMRELHQVLETGDAARLQTLVATRINGFARSETPLATA